MPRGMRAVFGDQREGVGIGEVTMLMATESWLPVTCYCESKVVGATQREIRSGLTRSCGLLFCGPGRPVGLKVTSGGTVLDVPITELLVEGSPATPNAEARTPAYRPARELTTLHRDNEAGRRVRERRDTILHLWAQEGRSSREIARFLGIEMSTVNTDIYWLRDKGFIGYRHQRRAG